MTVASTATLPAVVPVTKEQIRNLAALDTWLEVGPHYVRNAAIGAALGAGLVALKIGKKPGLGKYAVGGAIAGALGSFLFFQVGKWASKKEHEVLASAEVPLALKAGPASPTVPVVTKGYFAGAPRALYPTVNAQHHYR
jgi:hypothetical protein